MHFALVQAKGRGWPRTYLPHRFVPTPARGPSFEIHEESANPRGVPPVTAGRGTLRCNCPRRVLLPSGDRHDASTSAVQVPTGDI
jgi:hypothetical protein